ncbi:putative Rho-GTPase-activating protein [Triangularia verruculosa]|uniref:Rho-GTPase-activating protein n=1 Tax=Triangularia verruculosa TaxID=2587418 RepID=A0AAN7AYY5_9PEZI|nr:putative Rho-GTPase-activating protein [Triangularia verruculosa]
MTTATEGDEGRGKRMVKHKRSVSDFAMHLVNGVMLRRDSLKDEDLQSLVRLCGKSLLYLPSEYAAGSLVLPTCFRATAQYLVQHAADTQGVFRIPGSVRVVNALYEYYCCAEGDKDEIASTIRCPNLPSHIKVGTHDVASTFKRLLAGLPGGILGSLALFDALVAIHSQLKGDPEFPRTKQTKLRARLIALAIGTVRSQFRRELICAVFGLLCLIGRTAEKTPREDELGRPLPTADLMGYNALGIVFGPLLVGDLIHGYTMRIANPNQGLVLFPVTPPATRRERRKSKISMDTEASHSRRGALSVDKIHVANSIAEMLIVHWREVVKHMKNLDVLKSSPRAIAEQHARHHYRQQEPSLQEKTGGLRPSASESFVVRKPAEWANGLRNHHSEHFDAGGSPVPPSPTPDARRASGGGPGRHGIARSSLSVQRQRPKTGTGNSRSSSQHRVGAKASMSLLSPTAEEPVLADPEAFHPTVDHDNQDIADEQVYGYPPAPPSGTVQYAAMEEPLSLRQRPPPCAPGESVLTSSSTGAGTADIPFPNTHSLNMNMPEPPRGPSPASPTPTARRRLVVSKDSIRFKDDVTGSIRAKKKRLSQPSLTGGDVLGTTTRRASSATTRKASSTKSTHKEADNNDHLKDTTEMVMVNTGNTGGLQRTKSKVYRVKRPSGSFSSARGKDRSSQDNQARSSQDTARPTVVQGAVSVSSPAQVENKALRDDLPRNDVSGQKRSRLSAWRSKHRGASTDTESPPPQPTSPRFMSFRSRKSLGSEQSGSPTVAERRQSRKERSSQTKTTLSSPHDDEISPNDLREKRLSRLENGKKTPLPKTPIMTPQQSPSKSPDKRPVAESTVTTPGTMVQHHLRPVRSVGSAVKAMAAMFESASKEEAFVPTPMQKVGGSIDLKPSGVLAQYTVNPSPKKSSTRSMSPLKTTSPVKQIEMTKSESMGEVERRRTLVPPVVPPRRSRGSTETALWGGSPRLRSPVEFERATSPGLRSPPSISSTLERDENARPQTSFEAAMEKAKATKAVETDSPKKVDKVTGVVSATKGEDKETKPATPAPPEREAPARPNSQVATPTPQRKHRVSFSQTTTTRDDDDNGRDSHVTVKEKWSAASRASSTDHPEFPEQQQEEEERSASRQKTQTIALQAQIRSLQMQLVEKSGQITQLTRELIVKADIGEELEQLKEKLNEVEKERDMWRDRAEKAEERIGMFERVRERVRRAREEAGGEIGGMDGVEEFMEEYYAGAYEEGDLDYQHVEGGQSGYNQPAVVIQHHDDTFGQQQGSVSSPAVAQEEQHTQFQQPQQDVLTLHPGWHVQRKPVPSSSPTPSSENQQGPQDESFAERMKRTFQGLPRDVSSTITSIESSRSNGGSPYDMDEDYPGEILPFPPPPPRHRDGNPGMWKAAEEMFGGVKRQC